MRVATRRVLLTGVAMAAVVAAQATLGRAGEGDPPKAPRFVVHEWGTFTSVQGQDGVALDGLSREEEALPDFVYDRTKIRDCPLRAQGWKGLEVPAEHVTQKMETPVIYFHSATQRRVRVRVDFVKGLLSQWYPVADLLGPAEGALGAAPLDVAKVDRSFLQWDIDVLAPGPGAKRPVEVPMVAPDDPWAFAREVDANWVRTVARKRPERAGPVEAEKYLFYRGIGNFTVPLRAGMWQDDDIVVSNDGDVAIQGAIAFEIRGEKGRVTQVDTIPAGGATKVTLQGGDWWGPIDDVDRKLQAFVHERLVKQGLFDDEARAMVRTWSRSWFRAEGTRVLWIVPRATVDAILPLSIDPKPDDLVRVLVGRAEVIPPRVEREDYAALLDSINDHQPEVAARVLPWIERRGRFLEPHLRNVLAGIERRAAAKTPDADDAAVRSRIERWLEKLKRTDEAGASGGAVGR